MPLQWHNQIWQSLEDGAGKRCPESPMRSVPSERFGWYDCGIYLAPMHPRKHEAHPLPDTPLSPPPLPSPSPLTVSIENLTVGVSLPAHLLSMLTASEQITLNCIVSAQYAITFVSKPPNSLFPLWFFHGWSVWISSVTSKQTSEGSEQCSQSHLERS